ncbi:MAG: hypothetical protein U0441_16860 [Polyangiaceae bacterium]
MNAPSIEAALADITGRLLGMGRPFALVGGLAVSLRADARNLIACGDDLDLASVRTLLDCIIARGFNREEDLHTKLGSLLDEMSRDA